MQKLAEGFMKYEGEYFYEAKVSHLNFINFWSISCLLKFQYLNSFFRQQGQFKDVMVNEQREQNDGASTTKENVSPEK